MRIRLKWGLIGAAVATLLWLGTTALFGLGTSHGNAFDTDPSADYQRMDALLDAGHWQEANRLSMKIALESAGRASQGWFSTASVERFPCEALGHLDRLWSHHSRGRFGFQAQHAVYQQAVDADPEADERTLYLRFAEAVGWLENDQPLPASNLFAALALDNAPQGHLPVMVPHQAYRPTSPKSRSGSPQRAHRLHQFMERLAQCFPVTARTPAAESASRKKAPTDNSGGQPNNEQ